MNKEEILDIFYRDHATHPTIPPLLGRFDDLFVVEALQPANFDSPGVMEPKMPKESDSLSQTLSICSAFSRMTIDKGVYIDMMANRKKHDVFLLIEEENKDEKKWHYIDKNQVYHGPLSSVQMNDLFKFGKLLETDQVKTKYDDDYIPLKLIIKRYYKKLIEENNLKSTKELSSATKLFKKGERVGAKIARRETYKNQGRVQRALSDAVKINLVYLNEVENEDGSEDEEPLPRTRNRGMTSASR